jgi:probable F420-dependent oxidoreductase
MAPPVKIGLNLVMVKPSLVVEYARLIETLGFESIWTGEHVSIPRSSDWWRNYPSVVAAGAAGHEDMVNFKPDSDFLDPLALLAHLAAVTHRVRLGVGIYLLPLRHPILVGRTLATLDVLSGGRIDLGVGLGWSEEEYAYTGNNWKTRGKRMDETIRCLRALFEQETPEFHGEFFDFGPIGFEPKPVQKPFPIYIGGGSPAAIKRAATLGDGWHGSPMSIPAIKAGLEAAGRSNYPFQYSTITLAGPVPLEQLHALAAQGVDRVVVTLWKGKKLGETGREGLLELERYAAEIGLA